MNPNLLLEFETLGTQAPTLNVRLFLPLNPNLLLEFETLGVLPLAALVQGLNTPLNPNLLLEFETTRQAGCRERLPMRR